MSAAQDDERGTKKSGKPPADMRLPGSVAEIVASPAGPRVGAFFDLDGTLVAGFTAMLTGLLAFGSLKVAETVFVVPSITETLFEPVLATMATPEN